MVLGTYWTINNNKKQNYTRVDGVDGVDGVKFSICKQFVNFEQNLESSIIFRPKNVSNIKMSPSKRSIKIIRAIQKRK